MASRGSLRSEWLMRVPAQPASTIASGIEWPVNFPYPTGSMCWAKTGMPVFAITVLRSTVWGETATQTPVSFEAFSAMDASLTAFSPVDSL